jgi:hypothetical protein
VALADQVNAAKNDTSLRAGVRVNSRVKVAAEWSEEGQAQRAEGYTVDVSEKGCLAVIPREFPVGQRLNLVNLINHHTCEAAVAWRGHQGNQGWELGLELVDVAADFWEVEL